MKKVLSVILALVLMIGTMGTFVSAESALPFEDVKEKRWSYEFILKLFDAGIINGRSETVFAPTDNVTRAEFVKMLGGIAGIDPTEYSTKQFTDVKKKAWYAGYVAWAVETGVTTGMNENTFAPTNNITREQMATMIYRFAEDSNVTLPDSNPIITFADAATIAPYAKTAVKEMQQAGIINGIRDTSIGAYRFEPKSNATREQAAKMLSVLFDLSVTARREEIFGLIKEYINTNVNDYSTVYPGLRAVSMQLAEGISEQNDLYVQDLEIFYDNSRDEIGITNYYHDDSGRFILTTLCLPRKSGENCYYHYKHATGSTTVIEATGYIDSKLLGRGDFDFHFKNVSGENKNDPASIKVCEERYTDYLFEALGFMKQEIIDVHFPDYSLRHLGFNVN